jgi:hypothetical protein
MYQCMCAKKKHEEAHVPVDESGICKRLVVARQNIMLTRLEVLQALYLVPDAHNFEHNPRPQSHMVTDQPSIGRKWPRDGSRQT